MCLGSVTQGVVKFWLLRLSFSSSSFNQTEQHSRHRTTPCDRHGSKIHAKDIASSIMKTTVCSPSPIPPFGKIICIVGTHTCSWWPHHVANFTNSFYWNLELSLINKREKRNNRWMKGCNIFLALLCLTQSNENTVVSFKAVEKNVQ